MLVNPDTMVHSHTDPEKTFPLPQDPGLYIKAQDLVQADLRVLIVANLAISPDNVKLPDTEIKPHQTNKQTKMTARKCI